MCLQDCFALGLALIVSDDTPTSPPVTFGVFNLELKACYLNACRSISAFSRATSPSVHFVQTWEVNIWSSSTASWRRDSRGPLKLQTNNLNIILEKSYPLQSERGHSSHFRSFQKQKIEEGETEKKNSLSINPRL